jgi:primosomal protein N'
MFVIEVIPLSAGLPQGTLSYRSKKRLAPGILVQVPLRKQQVPALVVHVTSVVESKASLKAAGYALRGGTLKTAGSLPQSFVDAAQDSATYHGATLGGVLGTLLKEVLPDELPKTFGEGEKYETSFVEDTYEKRISAYRTIVKKQTEKKKATLMVAPTVIEVERLFDYFKEDAVTMVTGALRGKRRFAALAAALSAKSVVITTPAFAWLPMPNVGAVIIERASAAGYVLPKRPYLDMRVALAALGEHRNLHIVFGDFPLPLELRPHPAAALGAALQAPATLIDPRIEQKDAAFAAVPREMMEAIVETHGAGGRSAILAVRKGYGSAVVCRDCGNIVRDERGATLSLFTLGEKNVLRSADGVTKVGADAVCPVCGSWNLLPLGIGVERVIEEIKKAVPGVDVVRFDTDVIRTSAHAKAAQKRGAERGVIVVGTEIMLPFLNPEHPFDVTAIASADSLLALPFWRARERLVRIGLTLRERGKRFYIATRSPLEPAIETILHPAKNDFFKQETEIRKALFYPPFGHLVVFHAEGTKAHVDESARAVEKIMHPIICTRLADRVVARGRFRLSLVAKLPGEAWPGEVSERLLRLPLSITHHIDPESLW